jgi:putative flavoprotein involved in K+ transport
MSANRTAGTGGVERHDTVIVGAGPAGLAVGYHLMRRGQSCIILEADERIGDTWRRRWDSLRLFTPARYDGLPGMRFPAPPWSFPTKDELADYLEAYADRFQLPVRTGVRVSGLAAGERCFRLDCGDHVVEADQVVVATGAHRVPRIPGFAAEIDPETVQLHSRDYRNPAQLPDGPVLVVGVGNSGAEIAYELSSSRPVIMAGAESGQIPVRHGSKRFRIVVRLVRFLGLHVLTQRTPIGRRVGSRAAATATPLIRVKSDDLAARGVERVPRVVGVVDGRARVEDGRVLDVAGIVWCTGYRYDFSWIDLEALDERGHPVHSRGVGSVPGLYFGGLIFQFAAASDVLLGVGRDARHVARRVAARASRSVRAPAELDHAERRDRVAAVS